MLFRISFSNCGKKPKLKNKEHEKAWIIRAAKHRSLDILKSSWHKKRNVYEPDRQQVASETEKEDSLLDQIQKLPQKYREVLYLYYYEEYSVKEISNLTAKGKYDSIQTGGCQTKIKEYVRRK